MDGAGHQRVPRLEAALRQSQRAPRQIAVWLVASGLGEQTIVDHYDRHPLEGYCRLAFMMLDDDVVATSPASVYPAPQGRRWFDRRSFSHSKKGTGFVRPLQAHEYWHFVVSYINVTGTFYYLTSLFDGFSRAITHCEIRESIWSVSLTLGRESSATTPCCSSTGISRSSSA